MTRAHEGRMARWMREKQTQVCRGSSCVLWLLLGFLLKKFTQAVRARDMLAISATMQPSKPTTLKGADSQHRTQYHTQQVAAIG